MHAIESEAQVLIVDRDIADAEPLRLGLAGAGFVTRAMTSAVDALSAIVARPPRIVIVDWDLPRSGGPELVVAVRAAKLPQGIGLIIMSALTGEQDVVDGLNLGADDYVSKPYSTREVIARVKAVLRQRSRCSKAGLPSVVCGDLRLNSTTMSAEACQQPLDLSPVEYRLLEFLMKHPGRAFNRSQLLTEVWGVASALDERTVDVNVQRLRRLLTQPGCVEYIQTVRGFGYRFDVPPTVGSG